MESGEHARRLSTCDMSTQASMHALYILACMDPDSAIFCQISKIKVAIESPKIISHMSGHILGPVRGTEAPRRGQKPPTGAKGPQTAPRRS